MPAWGRYPVTRLAFAGLAWLRDQLAPRGQNLHVVVVADDHNLTVADAHDFDTVRCGNDWLGGKVNAGFQHAREHQADYAAFIGSDDWLHPDLFTGLDGRVVAGHQITVVDLLGSRMRHLGWRASTGVPPWLLPATVLDGCGWSPCEAERNHGLEGSIARRVNTSGWVFHDPHPMTRVDFKSYVGITGYEAISRALGEGPEVTEPWEALTEHYPDWLCLAAQDTAAELAGAVAA